MRSSLRIVQIAIVTTSFILINPTIVNGEPSSIEISSPNTLIRVGDPFTLKLVYRYENPLVNTATGKIIESFHHHAYLKIEQNEERFLTNSIPVFPMDLALQDTQGLEYSGQFMFFYHPGEKRLLFPAPSTYTVTVRGYAKISNSIKITVEAPLEIQSQALSFLSDPNDYTYLEFNFHGSEEERSKRMSHLKKVVEQCEGTILAKWCAARLGLEYWLYQQGAAGSLGLIRTVLGWPYTVLLLILSYLYGLWRLGKLGGPSVEEFQAGASEPWEGQKRGF